MGASMIFMLDKSDHIAARMFAWQFTLCSVINFFSVNIFKIFREFFENLQKMFTSHIHICRFHQAVFKKSQVANFVEFCKSVLES